jgi:hypothetical protein
MSGPAGSDDIRRRVESDQPDGKPECRTSQEKGCGEETSPLAREKDQDQPHDTAEGNQHERTFDVRAANCHARAEQADRDIQVGERECGDAAREDCRDDTQRHRSQQEANRSQEDASRRMHAPNDGTPTPKRVRPEGLTLGLTLELGRIA